MTPYRTDRRTHTQPKDTIIRGERVKAWMVPSMKRNDNNPTMASTQRPPFCFCIGKSKQMKENLHSEIETTPYNNGKTLKVASRAVPPCKLCVVKITTNKERKGFQHFTATCCGGVKASNASMYCFAFVSCCFFFLSLFAIILKYC